MQHKGRTEKAVRKRNGRFRRNKHGKKKKKEEKKEESKKRKMDQI